MYIQSITYKNLFVVEHPLLFGTDKKYLCKFHKHKLIFLRAVLRAKYDEYLNKFGPDRVKYIEFHEYDDESFFARLASQRLEYEDTVDFELERRLRFYAKKYCIELVKRPNPSFITSESDIEDYLNTTNNKKFFLTHFYIWQRKRLGLLMDGQKPLGGKWTFDQQNRKKIPKNIDLPRHLKLEINKYIEEAKTYVQKYFSDNPGDIDNFGYAVTREDALRILDYFFEYNIQSFGPYQDAIDTRDDYWFHSVISPYLNIGLITIQDVLNRLSQYFDIRYIASFEGFLRQIIGWREFIRMVYLKKGVKVRNGNFFNHKNKLPKFFYTGDSGIIPLDDVIKKVNKIAYAHHIERLMILGNFMLLMEVDPDEVYRWFMEMFIDAYDWVMVPNVYSMSQYADGGLITTKPYFSGSNYILKMSNYKKGEWCDIWDGLFWRFVYKNKEFLSKNIRVGAITRRDINLVKDKIVKAERFLAKCYS